MSYEYGMATVQEDYSRTAPPRRRRLVSIAAALAMMALFAGGLWFAYIRGVHQGLQASDGGVPLLRADPASIKVKPAQPGGMPVPNQDKLVYDPTRPETGVERLLPPPEQPLPRPVAPPAAIQVASGQGSQNAAIATSVAQTPGQNPAVPFAPPQNAFVPNAAIQSSQGAAAVQAAPTQAGSPAATAAAAKPSAANLDAAKKPAQLASLPPGSPSLIPPAAPQSILGVLQSVTGTRVQLGAVKTQEQAQQEWERLRRANSDLLSHAALQVNRADLGEKGVYYRIQTSAVGDASKLCDALKARKVPCAVIR